MAMGGIVVSPALAENKTVTVDPAEFFSPARVAIKPGESVTWEHGGGFEAHNVRFEDNQFTRPSPPTGEPFTVTRSSFPAAGVYRYYCETHGQPGGIGMSGVVYVNAGGELPPEALFTVSPNPAVEGQIVSFDATRSTAAPNRSIVKYEWDLNGNGMYGDAEDKTGATPTQTYLTARDVNVSLRVTDDRNATEVRTQTVRIEPKSTPVPDPTPTPRPGTPQPEPTRQLVPQPGPAPQPQPSPQPVATTPLATRPATKPAGPASSAFSFLAAATSSRAKGVAVSVKCGGRCRFTATLSISASVARKARLGRKATTIGAARGTLSAAGTKRVTVKLTSRARRRMARIKSVAATLKLAVVDGSGATNRKQKSVKLRR